MARLGKSLRKWQNAFLAYYWNTDRANNGGVETKSGLVDLCHLARGYRNRDHCRPEMLFVTGGWGTIDPTLKFEELS